MPVRAPADWNGTTIERIVPHSLAEEESLYAGPRAKPEGRLLVEGMLAEHRVIVDPVEELRMSTDFLPPWQAAQFNGYSPCIWIRTTAS